MRALASAALTLTLLQSDLTGVSLACAQQASEREQSITIENSSADPLLSPRRYTGVVRRSLYIPLRDQVRLAADVFLPAHGSQPTTEPLPLIWTHDRYQRATERPGRRTSKIDAPHLRELVRRGYIVAAVDARGCGASFGAFLGPFNPVETADAYDVIEWFAKQPWCDGNVGMYGASYLGATQYMAASTRAPHLKAIVPAMAPGDLYAFTWAGGIFREDFLQHWSVLTRQLDQEIMPARVDEDEDGALLATARQQHAANRDTLAQYDHLPFRDSVDRDLGWPMHQVTSPLHHIAAISASSVAIYHIAGWFDDFTRDALLLYHNLKNPQRIAIGPWFHQQNHEIDYLGEHLRWFDHWLKGIDNGVEDEPPIHYYTMGAPPGQRWRSTWEWPLPNERRTSFFFRGDRIPAAGLLTTTAPIDGAPAVVYCVDPTVTMGTGNRWANGYGGPDRLRGSRRPRRARHLLHHGGTRARRRDHRSSPRAPVRHVHGQGRRLLRVPGGGGRARPLRVRDREAACAPRTAPFRPPPAPSASPTTAASRAT
ncbi:MAG: CocE/NonD family hydrolase [Planctomycetota bacterium]